MVFVTVTCTSAVFVSDVAVTVAVPFAAPVIVTDNPFGAMFATPVVGSTVQVTVWLVSELPLASFGVAVIVVVSDGLRSALLLLSVTKLTVAGGGGFVVPPLLPPPPQAVNEQRTITGTSLATYIYRYSTGECRFWTKTFYPE
jgi:hypothetical protein